MAERANVTSIEAVREFRSALLQFGHEAEESLVMLGLEVRKSVQWMQEDRARYWPDQFRKAQERVVQARNDLERCQLHYGSEDAPSCYDQKKALDKAKRRLRYCEEKHKAVKRWIQLLKQELDEFQKEMAKMNNWLETDLPMATGSLERMTRALDRYTREAGGRESPGTPARGTADTAKAEGSDADPSQETR